MSDETDLRKWKKVGVVLGVIGALLGALTAFGVICKVVFDFGTAPILTAQAEEAEARAKGDSTIIVGLGTVARMVITPDSSARAILLERVQEMAPRGKP